jgi:ribosome-binding factor A
MNKKAYPRSLRLADLLKQEISLLFINDISDPRLSDVSITNVKLSKDLKKADIFYVSNPHDNKEDLEKAFLSVGGFIKTKVSKKLSLRKMPMFNFYYDMVFEDGIKIEQKLKDIKDEN